MARAKINKAAKIRETFETLGHDARPKDVVASLLERKIKVAPTQVSNIKAMLNGGSKKTKKNGAAGKISVAALHSAKKLVDEVGSLEGAKQVLEVLGKLR